MGYKIITLLIATGLFLISCDLDDLGVEIPEIPEAAEAPDFSKIEMNTGTFSATQAKAEIAAENAIQYEVAASIVNLLNGQLNLITNTLSEFMDPISNLDPDYADGIFTWNYTTTVSLLMSSIDVELRAGGLTSISWSGLITGNVLGEQVEDYEVLNGTTSAAGDTGNMNLVFDLTSEDVTLSLSIDWILSDDVLTDLTFELSNPALAGPSEIEFTYTLDGTSAQIEGVTTSEEGTVIYTINWDTETEAGSLTTLDLGTLCWDSAKEATEC